MGPTWHGDTPPDDIVLDAAGWVRAGLRGTALVLVILLGLAVKLPLRAIETLFSSRRPASPHVTQAVCRLALPILGLRLQVRGQALNGPGAVVANHSSWLDIFVLNAAMRVTFVSKDEVADWPGIGLLARVTGTVFIARDRAQAQAQTRVLTARLAGGDRLLFFPEGTSTDGGQVLPFKSALFAALLDPAHPEALAVQPVSVVYHPPACAPRRLYGWWGDMEFGPHLLAVLGAPGRGRVEVTCLAPLHAPDRKTLARRTEAAVRAAHAAGRGDSPQAAC